MFCLRNALMRSDAVARAGIYLVPDFQLTLWTREELQELHGGDPDDFGADLEALIQAVSRQLLLFDKLLPVQTSLRAFALKQHYLGLSKDYSYKIKNLHIVFSVCKNGR